METLVSSRKQSWLIWFLMKRLHKKSRISSDIRLPLQACYPKDFPASLLFSSGFSGNLQVDLHPGALR